MRTLMVNGCAPERSYEISDPDATSESEFEVSVGKALACLYPGYDCCVFGGGFRYDDRVYRPDLALVAKNRSHWFVIEVELVSHSFRGHVLPQVRAFRYGTPEPECITILARELKMDAAQVSTLVTHVPRTVAVIANKPDARWAIGLEALNIQMLSVSVFRSPTGDEIVELDGTLEVVAQSLGFGQYTATDRSLRFPLVCTLPLGNVQINDPHGRSSTWVVSEQNGTKWVTKELGVPDIEHESFVQLIQTVEGGFAFRYPRSSGH